MDFWRIHVKCDASCPSAGPERYCLDKEQVYNMIMLAMRWLIVWSTQHQHHGDCPGILIQDWCPGCPDFSAALGSRWHFSLPKRAPGAHSAEPRKNLPSSQRGAAERVPKWLKKLFESPKLDPSKLNLAKSVVVWLFLLHINIYIYRYIDIIHLNLTHLMYIYIYIDTQLGIYILYLHIHTAMAALPHLLVSYGTLAARKSWSGRAHLWRNRSRSSGFGTPSPPMVPGVPHGSTAWRSFELTKMKYDEIPNGCISQLLMYNS